MNYRGFGFIGTADQVSFAEDVVGKFADAVEAFSEALRLRLESDISELEGKRGTAKRPQALEQCIRSKTTELLVLNSLPSFIESLQDSAASAILDHRDELDVNYMVNADGSLTDFNGQFYDFVGSVAHGSRLVGIAGIPVERVFLNRSALVRAAMSSEQNYPR